MNEFLISLNGTRIKLNIGRDGIVNVDGCDYQYELIQLNSSDYLLKLGDKIYEIHNSKINNENSHITVNGKLHELTIRTALQERAAKLIEQSTIKSLRTDIRAPMPGMILKIKKSLSEKVNSGEPLLILEAMKMENELKSPVAGIIKNIYITEGSPVEKGTLLFSIE